MADQNKKFWSTVYVYLRLVKAFTWYAIATDLLLIDVGYWSKITSSYGYGSRVYITYQAIVLKMSIQKNTVHFGERIEREKLV